MTNAASPDVYVRRNAVDPQGTKIGSVGQVHVNDETGRPDWITVNTGLFGMKENFAPLAGSSFNGDDLVLPFDKTVVEDSPDIADASHLDADEQHSLYGYYQQYLGTSTAGGYQQTTTSGGDVGYQRGGGYDTSGPVTDEAMTRSEEHLKKGTEQVEAGRPRLRKYVVTQQQSVQVPVSGEEVRMEREPITDANRGLSGGQITEEEHEVMLTAERARRHHRRRSGATGRLGTETVTEQQTVTGDVRKKEVEVDDPTPTGR
jgi:uncharacterized protein (TIGR02271 family)